MISKVMHLLAMKAQLGAGSTYLTLRKRPARLNVELPDYSHLKRGSLPFIDGQLQRAILALEQLVCKSVALLLLFHICRHGLEHFAKLFHIGLRLEYQVNEQDEGLQAIPIEVGWDQYMPW